MRNLITRVGGGRKTVGKAVLRRVGFFRPSKMHSRKFKLEDKLKKSLTIELTQIAVQTQKVSLTSRNSFRYQFGFAS